MIPFYYFAYIFFHTYLKIMKLALSETKLNKLSRKEKITLNEGRTWILW